MSSNYYSPNLQISSGTPVTSSPYQMLATDDKLNVDNPAITAITGPVVPVNFKNYTIKDSGGNAGTYPITFTPYSGLIDGQSTYVIDAPYGSIVFYFDGTNYNIGAVR